MSRIKEWLGSDSSFEDAVTNGNDWWQIKAGQPVPEDYYITNYEQMVCNGHWPNYKTIGVNCNEH